MTCFSPFSLLTFCSLHVSRALNARSLAHQKNGALPLMLIHGSAPLPRGPPLFRRHVSAGVEDRTNQWLAPERAESRRLCCDDAGELPFCFLLTRPECSWPDILSFASSLLGKQGSDTHIRGESERTAGFTKTPPSVRSERDWVRDEEGPGSVLTPVCRSVGIREYLIVHFKSSQLAFKIWTSLEI